MSPAKLDHTARSFSRYNNASAGTSRQTSGSLTSVPLRSVMLGMVASASVQFGGNPPTAASTMLIAWPSVAMSVALLWMSDQREIVIGEPTRRPRRTPTPAKAHTTPHALKGYMHVIRPSSWTCAEKHMRHAGGRASSTGIDAAHLHTQASVGYSQRAATRSTTE